MPPRPRTTAQRYRWTPASRAWCTSLLAALLATGAGAQQDDATSENADGAMIGNGSVDAALDALLGPNPGAGGELNVEAFLELMLGAAAKDGDGGKDGDAPSDTAQTDVDADDDSNTDDRIDLAVQHARDRDRERDRRRVERRAGGAAQPRNPGQRPQRVVPMARAVRAMTQDEIAPWQGARLGQRIPVDIGRDAAVVAMVDRVGAQRGFTTRSGVLEGHPLSRFTLIERDGVTAGVFTVPDVGTFQIRTEPGGTAIMIEVDQEAMPGCGRTDGELVLDNGIALPADADTAFDKFLESGAESASDVDTLLDELAGDTAADGGEGGDAPDAPDAPLPDGNCDDGSIIDVLIAYTPAARAAAGGTAAIEAEAVLSIAATNDAYANSNVAQRLRLVHLLEVNYTESTGTYGNHLSRLRHGSDGYMDDVHTLRETYGADMVSLFVNDGQYCGLAYLMSSPSASFDSNAFSVVTWTCAAGYYSFAHELGHNMGSCHDHANCSGGASSYSYGHRFYGTNNAQYRTIMAYSPGMRVQWFSNPDVLYQGTATGVDGGSYPADNARTMDDTALIVANFRCGASSTGEYIGPPGGRWLDGANWGGGVPPDGSIDVVLDESVVIDGPGAVAASVTLAGGATLTLSTANATLTAPVVTVPSGTTLAGIGTITGDVVNGGLVTPGTPGSSVGTLSITGDYTQLVTGELGIELDGYIANTQHDVLAVSGTADIDGALTATTLGGFTPEVASATFLTAGSVTGAFVGTDVPALAGAYSFALAATGTDASLVTVAVDSCRVATSSQWASSVIDFSSQWSTTKHAAVQTLGPPDVPTHLNSPLAWAPSSRDGTQEYVTLGVDAPVYATGVEVRETHGGGFVYRVDVVDTDDALHTVWTGTDPSPANQATNFRITWPETDYLVDGVRIYVDTDSTSTWEEIDAVRLIGVPGPMDVPAEIVIDYSSQWSSGDYSAAQTLGAANVPGYLNHTSAWAASSRDGTQEYVTVGVHTPMYASGVTIRETYGNGFVTQIDVVDLDDELHTVWTGTDPSTPGSPAELYLSWPETGYPVRGVRVHVNTDATSTWEEIDAITLHGVPVTGAAWVSEVVDYSSQFTAVDFGAVQILGAPDVPVYGNSPLAWAPASQNGTLEHVTLRIPDLMYTTGVTVRETLGNGFVYKVEVQDVDGQLHTVWTGTDPSTPGAIADFQIQWTQTSFLGAAVRIHVDTDTDAGWEEIDAVLVHGSRSVENDCNGNGINDTCDIMNGTSADANLDGFPDECLLAPTVDALVAAPNPVARNRSATLTATNATDGNGDLDHVDFYYDTDADGVLSGADTMIGTDGSAAGGWSWTESAAGYTQGTHRFFARAEDAGGRKSDVVTTLLTVDAPYADGAYVGTPGGSWFTPSSWGESSLPDGSTAVTTNVDVVIDAGGAAADVVTVQSDGSLELGSGGTLTATTITVEAGGVLTVQAGATLTATTVIVEHGATLDGAGTIVADVVNRGTLAPGGNLGTLDVTGDYTQETSGTLSVEIDGYTANTEHDVLAVTGTATLSGSLVAVTLGSFTPALDTATVLTAGTVTGTFAGTDLPDLAGGFSFTYLQSGTEGQLVTVGADSCRVASSVQWASSVIDFTSQFTTTSYAATQTLGGPNVSVYGNSTSAWAPLSRNGTLEHVTLGFDLPVYATGVMVRETLGNGFVYRVDVVDTDDTLHTVWTGTDPSTPGSAADFVIEWDETDYLVDGVRIYIDTDAATSWEEIDAVQLRGVPGPTTAYASSVLGYSSEWTSTLFGAVQTLGPPDVAGYSNSSRAWAASTRDGTLEHLTLGFPTPMFASGVTVRQTWGTGCVYRVDVVDLDDALHTVWSGTDPSTPGTAADTYLSWTETGYPVKGVKIYIDTDATPEWEEIDSVQLHGVPAPDGIWASSVDDFSTQFSAKDFAATDALGEPDVMSYGNSRQAWAPSSENGTLEHLTLRFPTSMYATGVTVRETLGNGFVYQVDVIDDDDVAHTVWTGTDPSTSGDVAEFRVNWAQTSYLVNAVKIYVDTDATAGWEEIDAVRLHGMIVVDGDCNGNGIADECDIAAGTSFDVDLNGIPDECEGAPDLPPAPDESPAPDAAPDAGDDPPPLDVETLVTMLAEFGACPGETCPNDLDDNGFVDFDDVLILIGGTLVEPDPAVEDEGDDPPADLVNDGAVAPPDSGGLVTVTGDYHQTADGVLLIEIGGLDPIDEHDLVVVSGAAHLAGSVMLYTVNDFELLDGEEIVFLVADEFVGAFDEVVLPGPDGAYELVYRDGAIALIATGAPPAPVDPAALDLDEDGFIGAADVLLLLDDWLETGDASDIDGSGLVDAADLRWLLGGIP